MSSTNGNVIPRIITNERYTPRYIIKAAKDTMGSIDCDPASNIQAQKIVQALVFHTENDSGLSKNWEGNIFLNPPYSAGLHLPFAKKLVHQIKINNIKQAIIITPSDSSPKWFKEYNSIANAICLTPRIEFYNPYKASSSNNATNFIFYYGDNIDEFQKYFNFGSIYLK